MKRWPKRELEKWGIRPASKVNFSLDGVSGVVVVSEPSRVGTTQIQFNELFTEALGHYLPNGVSFEFPVFMRLVNTGDSWVLIAYYLGAQRPGRFEGSGYKLWEMDEMPEWVKQVRWIYDGTIKN